MIGRIKKPIDLGDGHPLLCLSSFYDFIASADVSFLEHAEIEPWTSAGRQQCGHSRLIHSNTDAITGHARLSDPENCVANPVTITDTYLIVGQSFDSEVLAELSGDKIRSFQLVLPIVIRLDLVNEDRSLLTSMPGQIALTVSFQIQPADMATATHGIFPDRRMHNTTLPHNVARESDVHR